MTRPSFVTRQVLARACSHRMSHAEYCRSKKKISQSLEGRKMRHFSCWSRFRPALNASSELRITNLLTSGGPTKSNNRSFEFPHFAGGRTSCRQPSGQSFLIPKPMTTQWLRGPYCGTVANALLPAEVLFGHETVKQFIVFVCLWLSVIVCTLITCACKLSVVCPNGSCSCNRRILVMRLNLTLEIHHVGR